MYRLGNREKVKTISAIPFNYASKFLVCGTGSERGTGGSDQVNGETILKSF